MSIANRAFKNICWLFLSEVSSKGLIFLGTMYLARVLGKAGFGLFSLSLAIGVYLWTVVDMGVVGYGTREIARHSDRAQYLYRLLNSMRFMLAVSVLLIFCSVLYFIDMPTEKKSIVMAGSFYIVAYSLSPDWVIRGLEKFQYLAFGSFITALIFLSGIFYFSQSASDTLLSCGIYSFSIFAGGITLMIVLYMKCNMPFYFDVSIKEWKFHAKESFYFAINGSFNNINLFIPLLFMGFMSTAEELGTFSAPHRLTIMIIRSSSFVIAALYPVMSNLYITSREDFKETHAKFQKMLIVVAMPVCIIITFLSKDIVVLIFGSLYSDSYGILSILIWFSFLIIIRYSFGNALMSANLHRFNMFATGVGAVVITSFSAALIPKYSAYGAAWSLIGGEIVTLVLMIRLFKKKLGYSNLLRAHIVKVLLASTFMGAIISVIIITFHFHHIISIFIGMLGYIFMFLIMALMSKRGISQIYCDLVER
jgi:O-antigen/teichoic acid export membrane protein